MTPAVDEKTKQLVTRYNDQLSPYDNFAVATAEEYASAGETLKEVKSYWKDLDEQRKAIVNPINKAKAEVQALFAPVLQRAKDAEQNIKTAISKWEYEQEQEREKEEQKLREQAEHEQRLLNNKAERRAKRAEERGDIDKAEEIRASVPQVAMPVVTLEKPKVNGMHTRTVWKCRIVNASLVPKQYCIPDENALNGLARATKGNIKVPGCAFYSERIVSTRTK